MISDLEGRLRSVGDSHNETVLYLGYPLRLSTQEKRIVRALADAHRDTTDCYVATDRLQVICTDCTCTDATSSCSAGQIAVLVHRINLKAAAIGDRRLIVSHRGRGYRLNPHM